jgi:ATP-dependent DNA ligase
MKEFQLLKQLAATPGKLDKIKLLQSWPEPDRLKRLLTLTYDRFKTYRLKAVELPSICNSIQPDILPQLEDALLTLAEHQTKTTEAKLMIYNIMRLCTEENAKWILKILDRDLGVGIDESTINKAFPNLIPTFGVQLAFPVCSGGSKPRDRWKEITYPVIIEEKLDGFRCVTVVENGKVEFFTREGHPIDHCQTFVPEILKLRPGTNFVLDGELIAHTFNPDNKTALKNHAGNWQFWEARSMMENGLTTDAEVAQYIGLYIWDLIELETFRNQKISPPMLQRKSQLNTLFSLAPDFKHLFCVPEAMAHNEAEVLDLFKKVRSKGGQVLTTYNQKGKEFFYTAPRGEGIMIKNPSKPYEFKRSDAVLKVKEFYPADLRILDAYEGEGERAGVLGGLVLGSDCGRVRSKCGMFRIEIDRLFELWQEHKAGKLVGRICECTYMEISADGALRHSVFTEMRDDKTTTNLDIS